MKERSMSKPLVEVEMGGSKLNAILDTGAWRSYIRSELAEALPVVPVEPFEVKLGGQTFGVREREGLSLVSLKIRKEGPIDSAMSFILLVIWDKKMAKRSIFSLERSFWKTGAQSLMRPQSHPKWTIPV